MLRDRKCCTRWKNWSHMYGFILSKSVINCSTRGLTQMAETPLFFNHALLRHADTQNGGTKWFPAYSHILVPQMRGKYSVNMLCQVCSHFSELLFWTIKSLEVSCCVSVALLWMSWKFRFFIFLVQVAERSQRTTDKLAKNWLIQTTYSKDCMRKIEMLTEE